MTSLGGKRRPGLGGGLGGGLHALGPSIFSSPTATKRQIADAIITALSPAAWYRNATGVTSAGGFASQWDDYSGNARHLVQATGTNQPAYAAGVFLFDGADNYMVASSIGGITPFTLYMVAKQVAWANLDFLSAAQSGGALYQSTSTPRMSLYNNAAAAENSNLAVGSFGIIALVMDDASSSLRINNTAKTTGNPGPDGAMTSFILCSNTTAGGFHANAAFQEVALFSGAHNDATQSSVITALNNALTVF